MNKIKLDILAIGVHPDDVELGCSGTILKQQALGDKVGILDLTRGELGTRGSAELRDQEALASSKILGVELRENLKFKDGFFKNDEEHQLALIAKIRKFQPNIVLGNSLFDRHPDHGRAGRLIRDACFLAGLVKVETKDESGKPQNAWRPRLLMHYIQDRFQDPSVVVDISDFMETKLASVKAFSSQFYDPNSKEPSTYITTPEFFDGITARARDFGRPSGFKFAEGFVIQKWLGIQDIKAIF